MGLLKSSEGLVQRYLDVQRRRKWKDFFRDRTTWIFTSQYLISRDEIRKIENYNERRWNFLIASFSSHNKFQLANSRFPRSQISSYHRNTITIFPTRRWSFMPAITIIGAVVETFSRAENRATRRLLSSGYSALRNILNIRQTTFPISSSFLSSSFSFRFPVWIRVRVQWNWTSADKYDIPAW